MRYSPSRRLVAGLVAVPSLLLALSGPATAHSAVLTHTQITGFAATTSTQIRIDTDQVTFTGRLMTGLGTTPRAIPDETITLGMSDPVRSDTTVATATTGPDGTFTVVATFPHGGAMVEADFLGDDQYRESRSGEVRLYSELAEARVVMDPPSTTPVLIGHPATVTGTVEARYSDGTWHSVPGVRLGLNGYPNSPAAPTTDGDGHFSLTIPSYVYGQYEIMAFDGSWGYVSVPSDPVQGPPMSVPTRIIGFSAKPVPYPGRDQVHLGGTLQSYWMDTIGNENGWTEQPDTTVEVWFRPSGSQVWKFVERKPTYLSMLDTTVGGFKDGAWQLRQPAYRGLLPSVSTAISARTGMGTTFRSFTASPGTVRRGHMLSLGGRLATAAGPVQGQAVKLYFLAKGGRAWVYMATARTDRNGHFIRRFRAGKSGSWRAVYGGSDADLACTGVTRNVRVT